MDPVLHTPGGILGGSTPPAAPPVNSSAPAISGSSEVNRPLLCTPGTWSGSPSLTYQWYSDASPILGETTKVYEVEFDTIDTNITCVETAINAFGSDSATSNSLGPVVPPNGAIQTRAGALLQGRNGQLIINDQHGLKLTGLIIQILVEDGASNPRSLTASDIAYIGYWQLVSSVRQTVGSVEITAPVDVDPSDPWVNSGISNDPAGTLKIRLPYAAAVGDPDAIEIEITPVSGTVVIPSPIVAV